MSNASNAPLSNRPGSEQPKRRTGLIIGIVIAVVVIIVAAIAIPSVINSNNSVEPVASDDAPAYTLVTDGTLTVVD